MVVVVSPWPGGGGVRRRSGRDAEGVGAAAVVVVAVLYLLPYIDPCESMVRYESDQRSRCGAWGLGAGHGHPEA